MGARVSIQKGLPSDFDPWKLMSHIISEVGVPERRKYKNREKKRKLKKCFSQSKTMHAHYNYTHT